MRPVPNTLDFWDYLESLESRLLKFGITRDDLPGLTGFKLKTVWATLLGSPRYFSWQCLKSIAHVLEIAEQEAARS